MPMKYSPIETSPLHHDAQHAVFFSTHIVKMQQLRWQWKALLVGAVLSKEGLPRCHYRPATHPLDGPVSQVLDLAAGSTCS
jgi:hypothetical protein